MALKFTFEACLFYGHIKELFYLQEFKEKP